MSMLTDEQREALAWCIGALDDPESKTTQAILDTIRGLLASAAPANLKTTCEHGNWINGCALCAAPAGGRKAVDDVAPLVAEWIRSRGTSMDGESYVAAVQLAAFVKARAALSTAPTKRAECAVCDEGECAAVDCGYPCAYDQPAKQIVNWLRRNANAEQEPKARAAFIEAHNVALQIAATAPTIQCKLCNSSGHDMPCAYPTEINRQQAKRIAELEAKLATAPTMGEAARALPAHKEITDPWGYDEGGNYEFGYASGWNDCLDEIAEIDRANAEKKD